MKLKPFQIVVTLALVTTAIAVSLLGSTIRLHAAKPFGLITLPHSVPGQLARARRLGPHPVNDQITVSLLLAMNQQDQAVGLMGELYNPQSSQYHHWLATGEFAARFGPTPNQLTAANAFLAQAGLTPISTNISPFILQAQGPLSTVEAAFHVSINDYRLANGTTCFSNANDLQIPANLQGVVFGVQGLNNIPAERPAIKQPGVNAHYGAGPTQTGLTPSQIAGIYNAYPVYTQLKEQGQGITLAVFELSNYTIRDVTTYQRYFHLHYVPIVNELVDGGAGKDHSGALEMELDIELQIALAQQARRILVYQSPNTDMSIVDQYFRIANDNLADTISTSWGICEALATPSTVQEENVAFMQMALQGQSIFAAAGDNGAADCSSAPSSNTMPQVDDPASQPYMTGVGGTSFDGTFDPGTQWNPAYPALLAEHIWKNDLGGGGGGVSRLWASPAYQAGPGVVESSYSEYGAYCGQASTVLCREVPDVSMNADPYSGYSIYCIDPGAGLPPGYRGFLQMGGTSAAAPLWAAIAALADNFHKGRLGLFNFYIYQFDSTGSNNNQFHDITMGNNGVYPAEPGYDMSSGVGTPNIYELVTALKTQF